MAICTHPAAVWRYSGCWHETAVLEHDGRNWRIVHIHWPARAP